MTNPFMELIGSGEGDYNSYNRGTRKREGKEEVIPSVEKHDFSQWTIAEILDRQTLKSENPKRIFAIGKYQFIPVTLREGIDNLQIEASERFSPDIQDRLFNEFMLPRKRPEIYAYIVGRPNASLHRAQKAVSKEWASVEDPDNLGHVYAPYEKHGNKLHTTAAQVAFVLDEMRAEFLAQREKGLSVAEAYRAATTMGPGQTEVVASMGIHPRRKATGSHGLGRAATTELQQYLANLGYKGADGHALIPDGRYGTHTRTAISAFQRDHDLIVNGKADPAILAAVQDAVTTQIRSMGDGDAAYMRTEQPNERLSAYSTLAPAHVPGMRLGSTPVPGDEASIRDLQRHLNTLGVVDWEGQPLKDHGIYDMSTQTAVAQFQASRKLPVTGQPDESTRTVAAAQAFIADLQKAESLAPDIELKRVEEARPPVRTDAPDPEPYALRPFNDPRHPQHDLYSELKQYLPDTTSDMRLAQVTAACHEGGVRAGEISSVQARDGKVVVIGQLAGYTEVDLSQRPTEAQSLERVQTYDQQQAQELAQLQAQRQEAALGPSMTR